MCGVAGILSLGAAITEKDISGIKAMTELLYHRGPTNTGYFQTQNCLLGNARLAITDTDHRSDLPMISDDTNVVIGYNGFVSNFLELKQQYQLGDKFRFRGNSDTEVLLNLYRLKGIDFARELNGMFAIFIYDREKQKAFLVRDFFGIKPLFYYQRNSKIFFASELKSFFGHTDFIPTLNNQSIFHYFSLAYIPGALTPYNDVHELRPGHLIEFDLSTGKQDLREYYTLHFHANPAVKEADAVDTSRNLMQQSVERNLIADVPLGITLSGGMDSALILSMAHRANVNRRLLTFSLKIDEPSFDESRYQKLMVDKFKTRHFEIKITPTQIANTLFEHIAYVDEPMGNGGNIPSFLLAKEAAKHVTVLLSGEGGDEIFNGYDTHVAYKASNIYRQFTPSIFRTVVRSGVHQMPPNYKKLSLDFKLKRFTQGAELSVAEAHMFWRHVLTDAEKNHLFKSPHSYKPSYKVFEEYYNSIHPDDPMNGLSALDTYFFFADDLMVKNDRMFMAHSLETRFPMMDRKLAEYVAIIPPRLRVKNFRRRNIQKLLAEGLIPDEIINRRKSGLEIPYSLWVLEKLKPLCDKYFTKAVVEESGILKWEAVKNILDAHYGRKKDYGRAIWCILIFLIWFDMFVKNRTFKQYMRRP